MEKFQHRYDQQPAALEAGEGTSRVGQPEPIQVQPPVESAEGNVLAPLPPKHFSRKEKQLESHRRNYQKKKTERLVYQESYRKGHKKEIRVYQREYMRDYREGKRRRSPAEQPQQSMQVFPEPARVTSPADSSETPPKRESDIKK